MSAFKGKATTAAQCEYFRLCPWLCENAPGKGAQNCILNCALPAAPTSAIGFKTTKSNWKFQAQVQRLSFHTTLI
jgi:hypothetical protein